MLARNVGIDAAGWSGASAITGLVNRAAGTLGMVFGGANSIGRADVEALRASSFTTDKIDYVN